MRLTTLVCALSLLTLASPASATIDYCGTVKGTPDGFLAMRVGPSVRFETVLKLFPGDELWLDTASCTNLRGLEACDTTNAWHHVTSVRRIDARSRTFTQGWVYARYLRERACPDD